MAQFPLYTGPNDVGELRAYLNRLVNALNNPTELTGNVEIDGTLTVDGASTLTGAATLSSTAHVVGAATLDSTLGVAGDFAVAVNKFTAAASSGNILAAGTAHIVGAATLDSTAAVAGILTATGGVKSVLNAGTPGTGVTAAEWGDGYNHVTVLTVNTTLPAIAGGASLGLGVLAYTLPSGAQIINASYMSLAITQTQGHINANTPKVGLGSVIAVGAVSVLNGNAAFMDIITEQSAANCTGTATVKTALATSSPFAFVTEAAGSKAVYMNAAAAWAASGDAAALLTGTVVLNWAFMH